MRSVSKMLCTAAAVMMLPLSAALAQVSERTIKFSFLNQADHPQGLGAAKFAELAKQKSAGKFTVKLFPGGTLGGDLQTVSALQGGTIEVTVLNAGLLASQVKEFSAMDIPFLFNNSKEAFAVMDSDFAKRLLNRLSDKNLIGLGYWDLGFRHVTNSKHPITKLEDFSGLKLRVLQLPTYINLFNTLGANAVPMPFTELYPALETKAVDGQDNPVTVIYNSKLYEVQKYLSLTRHTYNPQVLLISKKFWEKLSPAEQKIIQESANEATVYQRKASLEREAGALEALKKAGMQVNELTPAETARIRDKIKPVIEKASQNIGEAVLADMNAAIATARKAK
ncbi:TRAP transporter substrate-binding protein [Aquabacterium sp.]|uniref:TRAP transporter substrate-binding protein n=1 Tax=Aquabacterium sp. TaxID=1872578 RepID=UPI0025C443AC|nr:TRAP transporter substrate-binding protein [Aquabacterium sp.]